MNPRSGIVVGRRPPWTVRLTLGAVLASMLVAIFFNVLVAWHLHTMTAGSDAGARHANAVHGEVTAHEASVAVGDIVDRLCEAIKHCPCAVVWATGQTQTWSVQDEVGWFALGLAVAFQSHVVDVPQHPPNSAIAVGG